MKSMRNALREVAKHAAANPKPTHVGAELLTAEDVYDALPLHMKISPALNEIAAGMVGATHHVRVHDDNDDFVAKSHDMPETDAHDLAHSTVGSNPSYSAHCIDHKGDCQASYFGDGHALSQHKSNAALYRESEDYASPTKRHWPTPMPDKGRGTKGFRHGSIPDKTATRRDGVSGVRQHAPAGGQRVQGGSSGDAPASYDTFKGSVPKPVVGPFADARVNSRVDPNVDIHRHTPEDAYGSSVKDQREDGGWDFSQVTDQELHDEMTRRRRGYDSRSDD